jgi:hypothetical protein
MFEDSGYVIAPVLFAVPTTLTLVVGIALIVARWGRLGPVTRRLGVAGCAVLLVRGLLSTGYSIALPQLVRAVRRPKSA